MKRLSVFYDNYLFSCLKKESENTRYCINTDLYQNMIFLLNNFIE